MPGWIQGYYCPHNQTLFENSFEVSLKKAQLRCQESCEAKVDCRYASLYYTAEKQSCLASSNDGCRNRRKEPKYHVYRKGIFKCYKNVFYYYFTNIGYLKTHAWYI